MGLEMHEAANSTASEVYFKGVGNLLYGSGPGSFVARWNKRVSKGSDCE